MKHRTVSKRDAKERPYSVWNAFVDLLAMEQYEDLTPRQRVAHLVFWYESEVQNGGHLQFFENRGTTYLAETIQALGMLAAACHQEVLRSAGELWLSRARTRFKNVEEFCAAAHEHEFAALDARFARCQPPLQQKLEDYLDQHQASFVVIA
jgi:hypothetical protein